MSAIKHVFIVNPIAGKKDCSDEITLTCNRLIARGIDAVMISTQKPGDCEIIAEAYAEEAKRLKRPVRIYACGGDGTLNGVVNGVMQNITLEPNDFVAITCIPRGSGNDFIKHFGKPSLFSDTDNFFHETRTEKIDVMQVDNRFCLNICSSGLDARIAADVTKESKMRYGNAAYTVSAMKKLFGELAKPYVITLDSGNRIEQNMTMVCVCNGSWYGGSYNPVPEADFRDGLLDVLIVDEVGVLKAASLVKKYQTGRYKECGNLIRHYKVKTVRISTLQAEPINLDGEIIMLCETNIKILPQAISFFAPREAW